MSKEGPLDLLTASQKAYLSKEVEQLAQDETAADPEHSLFAGLSLADAASKHRQKRQLRFRQWVNNNPARLVVLSFVAVILLGTLLLSLPVAVRAPQTPSIFTALFTATSATCVTGLVMVDTMTYWSGFGQIVLICLIQVGGLSLLTILSAFGIGLHRRMNLNTTRALQESTASSGLNATKSLVLRIISLTLATEALGALILIWRYSSYMNLKQAFSKGLFQAISAYCNAGFDLMGDYSGPFSSLCAFKQDPVILLCTAFLFISGGLGFVVWTDFFAWPKTRKLRFHSKLILIMTGSLLLFGTIAIWFLERDNLAGSGNSLGELSPGAQVLNAFFQSATLRTAGFNAIDQASLGASTKALGVLLMLIGAGPASTGGGIKVSTTAIVIAGVFADLSAKRDSCTVLRHRIKSDLVKRSFSILFLALVLITLCAFLIDISLPESMRAQTHFMDCLYESASAFGTVGVSSTVTGKLGLLGQIALICNMFLGRVGPASFALSLVAAKLPIATKVLPEGKTFVG